jgi:C-terminal processing protease CtpA/Prc
MSLVPNASLDAPDEFERSGMFVINEGKIVVAAVRPGTPAALAGIVKGDVIASVDDVQGAQLTLGAVRDALRRPSNTVLRLGIISPHASVGRLVTLTLADYV